MSFWSGTKKTVKYVAVGMPAQILGVPMLRASSRQLRDLYRSLTWPVCPQCKKSTLVRIDPDDPKATETTWHCGACKRMFTAPVDAKEANLFFTASRRAAAMEQMASIANSSRDDLIRGHRFRSRWYYSMAAAFMVGLLVNIALGASLMSLFNWLILTGLMFIFGLKAAYRCWQVMNGVVFEPGSFRHWFWRGRWFV